MLAEVETLVQDPACLCIIEKSSPRLELFIVCINKKLFILEQRLLFLVMEWRRWRSRGTSIRSSDITLDRLFEYGMSFCCCSCIYVYVVVLFLLLLAE